MKTKSSPGPLGFNSSQTTNEILLTVPLSVCLKFLRLELRWNHLVFFCSTVYSSGSFIFFFQFRATNELLLQHILFAKCTISWFTFKSESVFLFCECFIGVKLAILLPVCCHLGYALLKYQLNAQANIYLTACNDYYHICWVLII